MGLNPGKRPGKLADMGVEPEDFVFERRDGTDMVEVPVFLGDGDVLHQIEWCYRGMVVDFMYHHFATPDHPCNDTVENLEVARIDTCHSEVHKHQFFLSDREQVRTVIVPLQNMGSLEEAETAINQCYLDCYVMMSEEWETHSALWKGESAA